MRLKWARMVDVEDELWRNVMSRWAGIPVTGHVGMPVDGFYRATLCVARSYGSYRNSVCPSVCPSVCHTRALCPHGSTYDYDFFSIW